MSGGEYGTPQQGGLYRPATAGNNPESPLSGKPNSPKETMLPFSRAAVAESGTGPLSGTFSRKSGEHNATIPLNRPPKA